MYSYKTQKEVDYYFKNSLNPESIPFNIEEIEEIIKYEKEKFENDITYYTNTRLEQDIEERVKEDGGLLLTREGINVLKETSRNNYKGISIEIHDKVIKLDEKNKDSLRNRYEGNKEFDKRFYYIVKAKIETNPSHFFLVSQKKDSIYVIDSLGSYERNDFFETFIRQDGFTFYRNSKKLQYSSGACEIFAVKMAFYLARLEVFNTVNERFLGDIFVKKAQYELNSKKKPINLLHPVFENGLEEVAFGRIDNGEQIDIIQKRLDLLKQQSNRLCEIYDKQPLYNAKITFFEIFKNDIDISYNVLTKLIDNSIIKGNGAINNELFKKALFSLVKHKINELDKIKTEAIFGILAFDVNYRKGNISMILFNPDIENIIGDNVRIFEEIKTMFNILLQSSNEAIFTELLKLELTDVTSKYSSVRLGHMYFMALELKQMLKETKELEEMNRNMEVITNDPTQQEQQERSEQQ